MFASRSFEFRCDRQKFEMGSQGGVSLYRDYRARKRLEPPLGKGENGEGRHSSFAGPDLAHEGGFTR